MPFDDRPGCHCMWLGVVSAAVLERLYGPIGPTCREGELRCLSNLGGVDSLRQRELGFFLGVRRARRHCDRASQQRARKSVVSMAANLPGIICTGESYKSVVKLTFAKGASLKDPAGLFNASHDGNVRRAIDIREGEEVGASAFQALIREAVVFNMRAAKKARP